MRPIDLSGKNALVFGVANERSIAWAICRSLHSAGARLAVVYQNERLSSRAERLVADMEGTLLLQCDVTDQAQIDAVYEAVAAEMQSLDVLAHSIAFARR